MRFHIGDRFTRLLRSSRHYIEIISYTPTVVYRREDGTQGSMTRSNFRRWINGTEYDRDILVENTTERQEREDRDEQLLRELES